VTITIDVQYACTDKGLPDKKKFKFWAITGIGSLLTDAEFTIRLVDGKEIKELNNKWRGINKPTNVLSFPAGENPVVPELLGDVIICAPQILKEANEQNKEPNAHWAHMVIHGVLHLLGYDHINDDDAKEMESIEIEKLKLLSFPNPYE
jgi:probable rRNA maturation factor